MTDCNHCYGTMEECPVCGPFEYAPNEVVGGQRDAGLWVDGWALSGAGLDWSDRANQRGWCMRDTLALLRLKHPVKDRVAEIACKASPLLKHMRDECGSCEFTDPGRRCPRCLRLRAIA